MGNEQVSCVSTGVSEQSEKQEKKKPVKIKVSVYFDGTLNNRNNTQRRIDAGAGKSEAVKIYNKYSSSGSYQNDKSNIAKLEEFLLVDKQSTPNFDVHYKLYVEGIGTENDKSDSNMPGAAFGTGSTGIPAKVKKAVNQVVSYIESTDNPDKLIELLEIDSFGFSRGAAAARNFIHMAKDDKDNIINKLKGKTEVSELKFKFVGLFDTVSHYGYYMDDDVKELKLNAISKAEKVVQLAAADEYRYNFPLINVNSNGTQIDLPGVHSDVGGGYIDNMDELKIEILRVNESDYKKLRARYKKEIDWVIDQGWFTQSDMTDNGRSIELNRKGIKNTYALVPRVIMANHASSTQLKFNEFLISLDTKKIQSEANLNQLFGILTPLGTGNWKSQKDLMRKIRHEYFHFSAYYDGIFINVNEPEWDNGNPMTGSRKRKVYDG